MTETVASNSSEVDLLVRDAELIATLDDHRRELRGGWVGITDGLVTAVGEATDPVPAARRSLSASGALVTPGLVNAHHHLFQNLTRAWRPMTGQPLFGWMSACFPRWESLDEEAAYLSAWVGLAELAVSGCTTSTDMCYFHIAGAGDFVGATVRAAAELGIRFHPSRGCISDPGESGSSLIPKSVVQDEDDVLSECERLVNAHHDASWGAMTRIAFGPSMTFMMRAEAVARMIELADRLDVRLHTHVAESPDDDTYSLSRYGISNFEHFESIGLATPRTWVAHGVHTTPQEIARLSTSRTSIAHCPSSNCMLGSGIAPVAAYRAAGVPVGLGVDGSSSSDAGSLWLEARNALLLGKLRDGPASIDARRVLEMATVGGADCLGRIGELGQLTVGAVGDLAVWPLAGLRYAGATDDPVEAWLRCGPGQPSHTVVAGRLLVDEGQLVHPNVGDVLRRHHQTARRIQGAN